MFAGCRRRQPAEKGRSRSGPTFAAGCCGPAGSDLPPWQQARTGGRLGPSAWAAGNVDPGSGSGRKGEASDEVRRRARQATKEKGLSRGRRRGLPEERPEGSLDGWPRSGFRVVDQLARVCRRGAGEGRTALAVAGQMRPGEAAAVPGPMVARRSAEARAAAESAVDGAGHLARSEGFRRQCQHLQADEHPAGEQSCAQASPIARSTHGPFLAQTCR